MHDCWLVDIGSSRVKWQVRSLAGEILEAGVSARPEECARALQAAGRERRPTGIWLARVGAPEREGALLAGLDPLSAEIPLVRVRAQAEGPCGLHTDYAEGQLGVDRYCALVAARARCRHPVVLVDAGTAVTVDALAGDGRHLGGYLLPGRQLGWGVLQQRLADRIPHREPDAWPAVLASAPGGNSEAALERGWGLGLAGAVDRVIAEARAALGGQAECWLAGGDADWLAPLLHEPVAPAPDLVLDGLWTLARAESGA